MVVLGGLGLLLFVDLVAVLLAVRQRRALARRLSVVAARLDLPGAGYGGDAEDSVERLERLAESAVLRLNEADAVADRLAGALHELPQGVVVCDEQGRVVYRNEATAALLRPSPGDGMAARAVNEVLDAGTGGSRGSRTVEVVGPPRRTLSITGRPLDDGRRTVGAVAVVEDVSERRRLDVVRRDFVSNLTTEIKTPIGALGLLASTIAAESDPRLLRRLAERVQRESVRVGRIVDDLMEMSRIDAEVMPDRQPVPVHLVVAQAVEEARSLAYGRSITIDAAEAPRRLTVVGDRRQLVSALRHLLENAVKFSDDGTAVRLKVRQRDGWVEISVHDRGPGVPEPELDRIFECFYRVDRSRAHDTGGTGLGLTIASQVASSHGGEVQVISKEGEGSTFTLRLPAGPGARLEARKAEPARKAS